MGVCQMSDSHLSNAIKMLLKSMSSLSYWYRSEYKGGGGDYDPDFQMTEMKLEMLNRERTRREMVLKGWASEMSALEAPKTELIQGNCTGGIACSQDGCDGGCLVRVLTDGLPTYLRDQLMEESFVEDSTEDWQ